MGASSGPTSRAWAAASAIRSLNQYAAPFITTARPRNRNIPVLPSQMRPTSTNRTVIKVIQNAVFNSFITLDSSQLRATLIAGGLMRWAQQGPPSAPILACFRPFKGTVGARRVESASSKARLVPDVSNPAHPGRLVPARRGFPAIAPTTKPKRDPTPSSLHCPFVLLCSLALLVRDLTRRCVDPLTDPPISSPGPWVVTPNINGSFRRTYT